MTTDKEVINRSPDLDLEMLERPHLWTQGDVIFLKRIRNEILETGPCVLEDGRYIVRPFTGRKKDDSKIENVIIYTSAQMVIDDGWKVD